MSENPFLTDAQKYEKQAYEEKAWSNIASLGSTFSNYAGSMIDYSALKTDAAGLYVSAGQVELQAKQRANQLRQQFIQSAGAYMMGAANRGIAVQSGSVQANLQRSSENLGKDIQRMQNNAAIQARGLRSQAEIARVKAKYGKRISTAQTIGSVASSLVGAYSNYYQAGQVGKTAQTTTK